MMRERQPYPLLVWLFAFLLTALVIACDLYFVYQSSPDAALFSGSAVLFDSALLAQGLPVLYTSLAAAGIALFAGFILGSFLALCSRRTVIVSILTLLFLLAGGCTLFYVQLAPYLPPALYGVLNSAGSLLPANLWMAMVLLPLAVLSTGAFALALPQNLYKAALCQGATPVGTYVVFLLPRHLFQSILCYIALLPCALALALIQKPLTEISAGMFGVVCAVLTAVSFIMLMMIFLYTRKPRSVMPC